MTRSKGRILGPGDTGAVVERILEELARRRMTRLALADASKISLSTLEKVLSGRRTLTLPTIVRIEEALGLRLRTSPAMEEPVSHAGGNSVVAPGGSASAPDELGGYGRAAVAWLEGSYLTLRPSFGHRSAVYAYRTDIRWEMERAVLTFREAERVDHDFTQFGDVAVPHQSGHIYLITNRHGQHRMVVVGRPTITGEMHGLLTTLQAGRGTHLSPVATPIAMKLLKPGESVEYGRIAPGHDRYGVYHALLRRTLSDHYAELITP